MTRLRTFLLAAAGLAALGGGAISQPAITLSFFQLDVNFDNDKHQKNPWGYVDVAYLGSAGTLYFNLAVEGNWRIRNVPVLSPEGPLAPHVMSFAFDLGVSEGTKVKYVSYAAGLTGAPLDAMPTAPLVLAEVKSAHYRLFTGGGEPIAYTPPAPAQQGGEGEGPIYEHRGFPNQEAKKDECVPAAVSNSLQWLNKTYNLSIPAGQMTLEQMKVATAWKKENGGCDWNKWPETKRKYMEDNRIPVTTEELDAMQFAKVVDAMKNGCDVEIGINHHTAAITGIQKLAPGAEPKDPDYALVLTHDKDQDANGGRVSEPVTYDKDFGKFHGPNWVDNKDFDWIVVECPITPTPTPSSTPPPSHTPTPPPPSPTPTPLPPTATPTDTPTATATPLPPTATPTDTPTPTPTPLTPTALPTDTPTPAPTP
jgi:hypothetical protein